MSEINNKSVGKIISLFLAPSTQSGRLEKEMFEVDKNGIVSDKFYAKNINRSVLISSEKSYKIASDNSIEMMYGDLGENILLDFNPYDLKEGTQLRIGSKENSVILEISQHCTLCNSLSKVNSKLPKLLKDDRGIFAKVIQSGTIMINDSIYIK
jgi:MOSC domain-containing protein YiiM